MDGGVRRKARVGIGGQSTADEAGVASTLERPVVSAPEYREATKFALARFRAELRKRLAEQREKAELAG